MRDDPFSILPFKTDGQSEIKRPSRRAVAMNLAGDEGHVLSRRDSQIRRCVSDRSLGLVEKEIPGLVIRLDSSDRIREVEHQEITCVMGEYAIAVTCTNRFNPIQYDFLNLLPFEVRHIQSPVS
nr:hypothetical protein [Neorhizobium galegae]